MYNVYKKQLINQEGKIVSSEVVTGLFTIDLMGEFRVKSKELGPGIKVRITDEIVFFDFKPKICYTINKRGVKMAQYQDPNFDNTNKWDYNCGSRNDLDYLIRWGDFENDNTLTIKRENMSKIKISIRCWNSRDGWITNSTTKSVSGGSTSEPYKFTQLTFHEEFAVFQADPHYWGKRYSMEGKLEIYYNNGEVIDTYLSSVEGCFRKYDSNYYHEYQICNPADVQCEEN